MTYIRPVYVVEMRTMQGYWVPYAISSGGGFQMARENLAKARREAKEGWMSGCSDRKIERKFRIQRYIPG